MNDRLIIASTARAEDGAYLAMADIAELTAATGTEYRIIGGHMVTANAARHNLDLPLRQTRDAGLGLEASVLASSGLAGALLGRGHEQRGGNRFIRAHDDQELAIDVLVPAETSRVRHNRPVGDLFVDEAPGLQYALARKPFLGRLEVQLTTGESLRLTVYFPDAVAALCLKVAAFNSRRESRDAVDVWRLLETLNADGMTAEAWPNSPTPRKTAEYLHRDFLPVTGAGVRAATREPQIRTRVRALVSRIVGAPD